MNGVRSSYNCTATSKKDCRFWKVAPRKERCKGCEIYEHGDFGADECYACPNYEPRCKYYDEFNCTYTLAIVNRVVLDCKEMGLELIQKPKDFATDIDVASKQKHEKKQSVNNTEKPKGE